MGGTKRRKLITAMALVGVVAGMIGLCFASVPLYRMFCQATGLAGTPRTQGVSRSVGISERIITVRFDANVNPALPWQFQPAQPSVRLRLGEQALSYYRAHNQSPATVTGTATYNVVPEKVARYFNKLECFCFTEQTLAAGQTVEMPVVFFVDPALDEDPDAQEVTEVTLSYTFFRAPQSASTSAVAGAGADRGQGPGG
jgi:cytochrome c oxidase assembly protein subunit 11